MVAHSWNLSTGEVTQGVNRSSWAIQQVQDQSGPYKALCHKEPKPESPKLCNLLRTLIVITWCAQGCYKMLLYTYCNSLSGLPIRKESLYLLCRSHSWGQSLLWKKSFLSFVMNSMSHGYCLCIPQCMSCPMKTFQEESKSWNILHNNYPRE